MANTNKSLGLANVVSASVGLVIATSCLVSVGDGTSVIGATFIVSMIIAVIFNTITMASMAELNALMPNTTGGLAQFTMACLSPLPTLVSMVGGYLICNIMSSGVELAIFSYAMGQVIPLHIPPFIYAIIITIVLIIANLHGVHLFAKIQNVVAYLLLISLAVLGFIGMIGAGTGMRIDQPLVLSTDLHTIASMSGVAFWLFIGAEFAIPISKDVRNAKRNVPLGMILGLVIICVIQTFLVLGFHNYVNWGDLSNAPAPHLLYGMNLLGKPGQIWMAIVAALAVVSTQNSGVNSLALISQGMAKMNMMPQVFARTNDNGVPYFGVWFVSIAVLLFALISGESSEMIGFLILVGSVFWMISYIFVNVNVIILRFRLPNAPRNFKVPGGLTLPIIGILGTAYMILHISIDPVQKHAIWGITLLTCALLSIYSCFWIKYKMKMPIFRHVPINTVLAMENDLFYDIRKRRGMWR